MDLSWMPRCDPRHRQPIAQHPVTIAVDGSPWAVATEGHVLVAVREAGPSSFPPVPEAHRATLTRLLSAPLTGTPAELAALRAWAEPPQWPSDTPCPACRGAGTVECAECEGQGLRECECRCGDQHEADCAECHGGQAACPACDGTGHQGGKLPVRPGRIGPVLVNRELLARALAALPGDTATLAAPGADNPLYVDGPGWRVMVMPMRDSFTPEAPEWPSTP